MLQNGTILYIKLPNIAYLSNEYKFALIVYIIKPVYTLNQHSYFHNMVLRKYIIKIGLQ